jgi:hypothetical protein
MEQQSDETSKSHSDMQSMELSTIVTTYWRKILRGEDLQRLTNAEERTFLALVLRLGFVLVLY